MKNISSKNKNNSKKKLFLITGIILVLIGVGVFYYFFQNNNDSTQQTTNGTDSSKNSETGGKGAEQPSTLPDNSQSLTTDDIPVDSSASASITRLEEKDSVVHFSAKISGANELGRCVVTFSTPNDRPVTKEFDATKSNADYICTVDTSSLEFSYLGKWSVNLRYYSNSTQVTATSEVTIS